MTKKQQITVWSMVESSSNDSMGRELVLYPLVNQEWVPGEQIAPHVPHTADSLQLYCTLVHRGSHLEG